MVFFHNNKNTGTKEYTIGCNRHDHVPGGWGEECGRTIELSAGKAIESSELNELFCRSLEKNVEGHVDSGCLTC